MCLILFFLISVDAIESVGREGGGGEQMAEESSGEKGRKVAQGGGKRRSIFRYCKYVLFLI